MDGQPDNTVAEAVLPNAESPEYPPNTIILTRDAKNFFDGLHMSFKLERTINHPDERDIVIFYDVVKAPCALIEKCAIPKLGRFTHLFSCYGGLLTHGAIAHWLFCVLSPTMTDEGTYVNATSMYIFDAFVRPFLRFLPVQFREKICEYRIKHNLEVMHPAIVAALTEGGMTNA